MKLLIVFTVKPVNDPHVGTLPICYYNGWKKQVLENESCRRGENGQVGNIYYVTSLNALILLNSFRLL